MEAKEILPPCQNRYFVLYYVLHWYHDEETLDSSIPRSYLQCKKRLNLPPPLQSTIPDLTQ